MIFEAAIARDEARVSDLIEQHIRATLDVIKSVSAAVANANDG